MRAAGPAGTCDVRGVMLHPVRVPPASGSLSPRIFPWGIASAAFDYVVAPSIPVWPAAEGDCR
jgi:hypothetical protein